MELFLLFIFFSLVIFLFLALHLFSISFSIFKPKNSISKLKLPPGRTGWPVIGETLELASMGRNGTPEKFFIDRMRKYSSQVFKTSLLWEQTIVFCGAAGNKFLFSNENKLVTVFWPINARKIFPFYKTSTAIAKGSMELHNMLTGFLKPELLHKYVEIVDSVAKDHLETQWDSQNQVSVLSLSKQFTFTVVCRLFLSIVDRNSIENFAKPFRVLAAGIYSLPINLPGTSFNRGTKAASCIRKKLLEIIRRRKIDLMEEKSAADQDILTLMLTVTDDNGQFMTELEIVDKLLALLLSSQDSTSTTITFIVKYLAELPDIYHEVLNEQRGIAQVKVPEELLNWNDLQKMKYSWNVACEAMRLMPPLQGNFREAITDFTFTDFYIPKGSKIYWTPNSTHRDPQYFPQPEKFDPLRFKGTGPIPFAYVPFGGGPRICPGKELARLVILVFVYNLVGKFKWEKLLPDEKTVVEPAPMPVKGLPIRLHHH